MAIRTPILTRSLGDTDQHDVHDANSSNEQTDSCHEHEEIREEAVHATLHLGEFLLRPDDEIGFPTRPNVVALAKDGVNLSHGVFGRVGRRGRSHEDPRESWRRAHDPRAEARRWEQHAVVLIVSERSFSLDLEHPKNAIRIAPDPHDLPHGVLVTEKLFGRCRAEQ